MSYTTAPTSTHSSSQQTLRKKRLALAVGQALLLGAMSAQAATITVTNNNDASTADACTLRDAIQAANTDTAVNSCAAGSGTDSIVFDNSLTASATTITLGGSALSITSDMSINGANNITINAAGASRVMDVNGGKLTLSGMTLKGGYTALGGGLYAHNGASVSLSNCTISGNTAAQGGGGLVAYTGTSVSLSNSTVSGNSADGGGGLVAFDAVLDLTNSTVSGNVATGSGGPIGGGGVIAYYGATVNLTNSTVSGNSTNSNGGGIFVSNGINDPSVTTPTSATVVLTNSTVSGNSAANRGGGITVFRSDASLTNSTVSGNSAGTGGGGILAYYGTTSLTNSTVSGNSGGAYGGIAAVSAVLSLTNSIVANSAGGAQDCFLPAGTSTITADAHNIIQNDGCSTSAQNVDPMLGALADNGGPTFTLLPQAGSPAIDAGDQAACTSNNITTDQRGYKRVDGKCDIGAVEVGAVAPSSGGGGGATGPLMLLFVSLLWPLRRWLKRE
jgi:CSLREA domain-containing protein